MTFDLRKGAHPETLREIEEIEARLGRPIGYEPMPETGMDMTHVYAGQYGPAPAPQGFMVRVLRPYEMPHDPIGVCHEVAHFHRYIVQGVPALWAREDEDRFAIQIQTFVENDLEHLFIVPVEEARHGPRRPYWESHYADQLAMPRVLPEEEHIRVNLVRYAVMACALLPNSEVAALWESKLAKTGHLAQPRELAKRLLAADKPNALAIMLQAMGINPDRFQLMAFYPGQRQFFFSPPLGAFQLPST